MATPLIVQSVMVAICLSLLLPAFGRLSETWPKATVLVTTTMPSATPTRPDERVICPHRPKLTPDPVPSPAPPPKPKPATVAVKRPDTVPVPSLVRAAPDPRPVVATVPSDLGADAAPPDPASSASPNPGGVGLHPTMRRIRSRAISDGKR
jgi:hypothetical protein